MINKEQIKDLRVMKPEELQAGRTFYRKELDGSFATCKLDEFEVAYLAPLHIEFFKAGRLFVRKNKPYEPFV